MRLLIVGHSHVRTLRDAYQVAKRRFEVEYVASDTSLRYRIDGERLFPPAQKLLFTTQPDATTAGVEVARFDAIVISGAGIFAARNQHDRAYCRHLLFEARLAEWAVRPDCGLEPPAVVSSALLRELVHGMFWMNPLHALIEQLPKIYRRPILVQPFPLPSALVDDPDWKIRRFYGERWPAVVAHVYRIQHQRLQELATAAGGNVALLAHPKPEWFERGFYPADYSDNDPWHGNARYGALVLDQVEAALA